MKTTDKAILDALNAIASKLDSIQEANRSCFDPRNFVDYDAIAQVVRERTLPKYTSEKTVEERKKDEKDAEILKATAAKAKAKRIPGPFEAFQALALAVKTERVGTKASKKYLPFPMLQALKAGKYDAAYGTELTKWAIKYNLIAC